ncbi:MAG: ComEC family competence protein [Flavobacteriales bacterium]|nr:ComEC family competence protein [Flavobacteriales bacterium]MBP6696933.1 ComEC family competence protein [Flavobacteriales bacterium]
MERRERLWSGVVRAPMMRITCPFALGLLIGGLRWSHEDRLWWSVGGSVLLFAILTFWKVKFRWRWWIGPSMALGMLCCGMLWWPIATPPVRHHPEMQREAPCLVELTTLQGLSDRTARSDAWLLAVADSTGLIPERELVQITLLREDTAPVPVAGDRLLIMARFEPIDRLPDPGGFDARTWAASRGIHRQALVSMVDHVVIGHNRTWTDVFAPAQQRISSWLVSSGLPDRERALVKALVLGIRDELADDQKASFARSGTMHVLAVSGMHVALIYAVLITLLAWMGKGPRARLVRLAIVLLLLWGYAGLTGATPSVLRATVMCSLFMVAASMQRRTEALNTLFGAAFVLLLWDPLMIGQLSFQLSFLAVLGIILCYDPLRRLWNPANWVLRQIWSLIAVSLAAQLFTTPLTLYVFQAFPVWFLPANVLVCTLVNFAVVGGILLLPFHAVPSVGPFISDALAGLVLLLGKSTDLFAGLPGAYPAVRIGLAQCLLLYLMIGLFALGWLGGVRWAKWVAFCTVPLFLFTWALREEQRLEQRSFTVLDRRDGVVALLRHATEAVLYKQFDTSTVRLPKQLEGYERATGTTIVTTVATADVQGGTHRTIGSSLAGGGAWMSEGISVLFLSDTTVVDTTAATRFDVIVVLSGEAEEHGSVLRLLVSGGAAVLSPALDGLQRWRWRQYCEARSVACHDVRRDGAFIFVPHARGPDTMASRER